MEISVMIPNYNSNKYLEECIKSVLNAERQDLIKQIWVVDDCSTKELPDLIVAKFKDPRIALIKNVTNLGLAKNFNKCLGLATSDFVHILHSDDLILPGFYKEINALNNKWRDAGLYVTGTIPIDETGHEFTTRGNFHEKFLTPANDPNSFLLKTGIQFCSVVFNRTYSQQIGGFDEPLSHLCDRDFWLRMTEISSIVSSEYYLACYRSHADNDTSKLTKESKHLIYYWRFYRKHSLRFRNLNLHWKTQFRALSFNQLKISIKQRNFSSAIRAFYFLFRSYI